MNDIEILEKLEETLKQNKILFNEVGTYLHLGKQEQRLISSLLDLYKKEKERNKNLEQIEKEHKEENGRLREENKILRHGLEENTEEIDELNVIIDLMAEQLTTPVHSKKWVIDYFTNKVEEDK